MTTGHHWTFVWDALSGQEIRRFAGRTPNDWRSRPMDISLAAGDNCGKIDVWSVSDVIISSSSQGRLTISSLAFGRNLQGAADAERQKQTQGRSWRLAAGDFGGNVTVHVETGMLHVRCTPRDSRRSCRLLTRRHLCSGPLSMLICGMRPAANCFLRSAPVFVVSREPSHPMVANWQSPLCRWERRCHEDISQVVRWNIEIASGIQTPSLATPISQILFSPGGRYLAALASDWQIAIWDRHTGELKFVLNAPEGITPDNATRWRSSRRPQIRLLLGSRGDPLGPGSGPTPGVLQPGESDPCAGLLRMASGAALGPHTGAPSSFNLSVTRTDDPTVIDWPSIENRAASPRHRLHDLGGPLSRTDGADRLDLGRLRRQDRRRRQLSRSSG